MTTAEDIVLEKGNAVVSVTEDQPISEAIRLMNEHRVGAVLVQDGDRMVGIWTERDYLRNSADPTFDPLTARIGERMSSPLRFARHDATLTQLEEMILGLYVRHLPVEKDGTFIGMVSVGDVLRANLLEKDRQIKELNSIASWQYYENWGWDRKKR
jgi:CBS domain-containing protein